VYQSDLRDGEVGFNLNGYILRPARVAGGNSPDTDEATTGVERDHITPTVMTGLGYQALPTKPVEPYADMYRAAVLQKPTDRASTEEYCVFAAVTSSLSVVEEGDSVLITGTSAMVTPVAGNLVTSNPTLPSDPYQDGTATFRLTDPGGRDISGITYLAVLSADPAIGLVEIKEGEAIGFDSTLSDLSVGTVVINAAALAALGGGFSVDRGDVVVVVYYTLSPPTFWWTRNDQDLTRFGWDGLNQRWSPLAGTTPRDMGGVVPEETYKLAPPVTRFAVDALLPYPSTSDGYALLRLGLYPDSISDPLKIQVVPDTAVVAGWDGGWDATLDGVVGVTNGILRLNPAKEDDHAGKTLWYNPEAFPVEGDGDMGAVAGLPLTSNQGFPVLSPAPGPTERPFLRIGFRRYLTPVPVDTDGDLPAPAAVTGGQFYWSRTTGKIVLAAEDIEKATPGAAGYELPYLGAHLYYDGVAMSQQPIPVKAPVAALESDGKPLNGDILGGGATTPLLGNLWIDRAVCLPPPGVSGVQWVPDGSGETPDLTSVPVPQTRPVGNGLKRQIKGVGDNFFFSSNFAFERLGVDEYDDDLPIISFKVAKNKAEVAEMVSVSQPTGSSQASRVECRRKNLIDEPLYFRQCVAIPSVYAEEPRIYSRFAGPYTLGRVTLRFAINTQVYEWHSTTLNPSGEEISYTAEEVQASLQADTLPPLPVDSVGVARGRLFIQAPVLSPSSGNVEIGWNDPDQADLAGHAALGFLPGWRVDNRSGETQCRWLPDNGASMGVFRSPLNRNRRSSTPDIRSRDTFDDTVLIDGIYANPFVRVNPPPLEDLPGYGANSHFQTSIGLLNVDLENYVTTLGVGVKYDWANQRLIWAESGTTPPTKVAYPTADLQLSHTAVFSETVSSDAMLNPDYGFYLKGPDETLYSEQVFGEDFLMPGQAQPGQSLLVEVEGGIAARGGAGATAPSLGVFRDANVADQDGLYAAIEAGYLLHILNGEAEGVYQITAKQQVAGPGTVVVFAITPDMPPDIPATATAQWRMYEAELRSDPVVDDTLIADVQLVPTNHLPSEPFKIRLLSGIGTVGDTLEADVADAVASGREVSVRFGVDPVAANIRSVTYLQRGTLLGPIAETGLVVDPDDLHVTLSGTSGDAYFALRVGAQEYSTAPGGNLILVAAPPPPGGVAAGTIQVVGFGAASNVGEVYIATDIVSAEGGSSVYYDQLFLDPTLIPAHTVEINSATGEVQIPAADSTAYSGDTAYFVEQMITEGSLDVTTSPMSGSLLFNKPLREGQIVEVSYYQADSNGDKKLDAEGNAVEITEFLALTVRLEEATVGDSDTLYTYNPTGRTVSTVVEPFVWVGVELMNFAGRKNAVIEADPSLISLSVSPPSGSTVKINYGVLEAFGGEQAYTVSSPPVYRKPFFLEEQQTTFTLETDRRSSFPTGHLMVLGTTPLYIVSSSYSAGDSETLVTIWPPPQTEVGSRAVGRDARLLISDFPVAITIDPNGAAPVPGGGSPGFLASLDLMANPLLPVDKGQLSVGFYGDVRKWTRPNHLLEIDGYPYIILTSSLSEDGRNTKVQLATPVYTKQTAAPTVRVSTRPVYGPSPMAFNPIYPVVGGEDYSLFLLGSVDSDGNTLPGKELVEGTHYALTKPGGAITFQQPTQGPLQAGEVLHLRYTRRREVSPLVNDGALIYPLYKGGYLYLTTPSEENRLQGGALRAQYTYRSPDSFFFAVETLEEYLGEVAVVSASKGGTPVGGGPPLAYPGSPDLTKKGTFGLRGETADLGDQDRAARVYVEFFNRVIVAFEQVLEALDGRIIGDRDGKFRFFIGHDKRYAPPGWEDEITGVLNKRLIWREIIENWAPAAYETNDGFFIEADPIYNPITAEVPDSNPALVPYRPGDTNGENLDPDLRQFFINRQKSRIKNDMDDRVLIGTRRPKGLPFFLFPLLSAKGRYKDMWQDHFFSRLFPETTKHFSRLMPGLEAVVGANGYTDPGFYSFGRLITKPGPEPGEETDQVVRTRGTTIGTVANPALGEIPNIVDITAEDRRARGRMWIYLPKGFSAANDATLGVTTQGFATIVATPLPLSEFPIDQATGLPDVAQLLYNNGGTPSAGTLDSLDTGNIELSTPAFEAGQRLSYGQPNGRVYALTDPDGFGVCVSTAGVQKGCVITLASCADPTTQLPGTSVFVIPLVTKLTEVVSDETGYGDTIFAIPSTGTLASPIPGDPPTTEEMAELIGGLPDYRIQFDMKVRRKRGEFVDASLPTPDDIFPFPFQELLGQKPPAPLTCIEGSVDFNNTEAEPAQLPCLLGEPQDDSGDNQLPYMKSLSELDALGKIAAILPVIFDDNTSEALPFQPDSLLAIEEQDFSAVSPDEILVTDGTIPLTSAYTTHSRNAATLYTGTDVRPVGFAGSYTPNSGIGDLRRYDLLLIETKQPSSASGGGDLWDGATGILTVGNVGRTLALSADETSNSIEVPRFVTAVDTSNLHQYTVRSFAANVEHRSGEQGVRVNENVVGLLRDTTFDFTTVSDLDLTGLTALLTHAGPNFNALVIRFYHTDPAHVGNPYIGAVTLAGTAPGVGQVIICPAGGAVTTYVLDPAGIGTAIVGAAITCELNSGATTPVTTLLGISTGTPYDFTLDIDTYIDVETFAVANLAPGSGAGSTTCRVMRDRMTFREDLAFNKAVPRGFLPANDWDFPASYVSGQTAMETAFGLQYVTINGQPNLTVNSPGSVNGGDYFTFLERVGPDPTLTVPAGTKYVGVGNSTFSVGFLQTMSWEGFHNEELPSQIDNIVLSAVPSSDLGVDDVILESYGTILDGDSSLTLMPTIVPGYFYEGNRNYILNLDPTPTAGATANVESGDIVVVDTVASGAIHEGAIKAGTYLTRYAMVSDGTRFTHTGSPFGEVPVQGVRQTADPTSPVPVAQALTANSPTSDTGFLDLTFPYIISADEGTNTIVLGNVVPVAGAMTGHGFLTSRRLYLVFKEEYAAYSADADGGGNAGWVLDKDAVWSKAIQSLGLYDAEARTLVLNMNTSATAQDAAGALSPSPPTKTDFYAAAVAGTVCSGMDYLPVQQLGEHLPSNNVMGADTIWDGADPASLEQTMGGWRGVTIHNMNPKMQEDLIAAGGAVLPYMVVTAPALGRGLMNSVGSGGASGQLIAATPEPKLNTEFYDNPAEPVYGRVYNGLIGRQYGCGGVVPYFDLSEMLGDGSALLTPELWYAMHFYAMQATFLEVWLPDYTKVDDPKLHCLLPGDRFTAGTDIDPTLGDPMFYALGGVFLEPSFPRPVLNNSNVVEKVVANTYTMPSVNGIGIRSAADYGSADTYEDVRFFVRRIRRWHNQQEAIVEAFKPLRYIYETRRGVLSAYTPSSRIVAADTTLFGTATQLGDFTNPLVNIHAGDVLRVLAADGTLLAIAEIQEVASANTLKLRRPGLDPTVVTGSEAFEIYLEQPLVPQEQSNDQLLEMVTSEEIYRRTTDYPGASTDGGSVAETNELQDTGMTSWEGAGVQADDYVVIDPAGVLYISSERGIRPFGDQSCVERPVPIYDSGGPKGLDDNRGFYKVVDVDKNKAGDPAPGVLVVDGECRFTQSGEPFGAATAEYVVLPTIHNSQLTGGDEDQQALRPTAAAVVSAAGLSFADRTEGGVDSPAYKSIEPFAFRIIRPNPIFSKDALELVLFMRERLLSWAEEIRLIQTKAGDYYIFQKEIQIEDVGNPTGVGGLGLLTNAEVEGLEGLVSITPFANTKDCLSVLDRRVWILDYRLDADSYTDFATNSLVQRPVLPDYIDDVLNLSDLFREQRFGWISFRANRQDGSIQAAKRAVSSLGKKLAKARRALARQRALDKS